MKSEIESREENDFRKGKLPLYKLPDWSESQTKGDRYFMLETASEK